MANVATAQTAPNSSHEPIRIVVYLASLVSDPQAIEPMIETVRGVTSRYAPGQPLDEQDQALLYKVRLELEDYLVNRDPVRAFTTETLTQQVAAEFGPRSKHRRSTRALMIVLAGSVLLGMLPFFLGGNLSANEQVQLVLPLFFCGTHAGIAWFFLSTLANFQSTLRRAFGWLVLGEVLVGIVGSQLTIITLLGLEHLPWFRYAGFMPLFTLAYIPLYIGLLIIARQLKVQSRALSVPLFVSLVAGAGILAVLLPHHVAVTEEIFYDVAGASIAMCTVMIGWCAWLAFLVTRQLTPLYARAMKLLGWSFAVDVGPLTIAFAILSSTGQLQGSSVTAALSPFLIAEILLLLAGYYFKRISD